MGHVSTFHLEQSGREVSVPDFRLLQLTKPSHKVELVKNGTDTYFLVYLHEHHEIPFLRISSDVLLSSVINHELC